MKGGGGREKKREGRGVAGPISFPGSLFVPPLVLRVSRLEQVDGEKKFFVPIKRYTIVDDHALSSTIINYHSL